MDAKTKTLVYLINDALKIAEDRLLRRETGEHDLAPLSGLEAIVASLWEQKRQALDGTLKPSGGHDNVGLNRELLEWGEWGTELFRALESIQDFYKDNF
jgi:hypothetical protein